jgi:serine/threonine protein phosphatase PrpC
MFSPKKQRMYIGHVGDSRCYRVREGKIQQLTRDHSLINDYLVAMPDLTEEQRSELPKNVITRALGMQDQVVVDLQHDDPVPNDVYVLCSDGLSGMIPDEEIMKIVTSSPDIREGCKRLIARANESGGEDNITAVLIKIEDTSPERSMEPDGDTEERLAASKTSAGAAPDDDDDPNFAEEPTMPGIQPDKPSRP